MYPPAPWQYGAPQFVPRGISYPGAPGSDGTAFAAPPPMPAPPVPTEAPALDSTVPTGPEPTSLPHCPPEPASLPHYPEGETAPSEPLHQTVRSYSEALRT